MPSSLFGDDLSVGILDVGQLSNIKLHSTNQEFGNCNNCIQLKTILNKIIYAKEIKEIKEIKYYYIK